MAAVELVIEEKQEVTVNHARSHVVNILEDQIEGTYNLDEIAVQVSCPCVFPFFLFLSGHWTHDIKLATDECSFIWTLELAKKYLYLFFQFQPYKESLDSIMWPIWTTIYLLYNLKHTTWCNLKATFSIAISCLMFSSFFLWVIFIPFIFWLNQSV